MIIHVSFALMYHTFLNTFVVYHPVRIRVRIYSHCPLLVVQGDSMCQSTENTEALCHSRRGTTLKGKIMFVLIEAEFGSPSTYLKREKKVNFFYTSYDLITQMIMITIRFFYYAAHIIFAQTAAVAQKQSVRLACGRSGFDPRSRQT